MWKLRSKVDKKIGIVYRVIFYMGVFHGLLLLAMLVLLFRRTLPEYQRYKLDAPIERIEKNILLTSSSGETKLVDLPYKQDSSFDYSYNFVINKPDKARKMYVKIRSDYMTFKVLCGDEEVYATEFNGNKYSKTSGHNIRLIRIDDKYLDKELKIVFHSSIDSRHGIVIPALKVGSENDLLISTYEKDILATIMGIFLLGSGLVIAIVVLFLYRYNKQLSSISYIALLFILVAIHVFINTEILHILFPKPIFIYYLDYIVFNSGAVVIMGMLISKFKSENIYGWRYRLLWIEFCIAAANVEIQFFLQFFGVREFIEMQIVSHIVVAMAFIIFTILPLSIDGEKCEHKSEIVFSTLPLSLIFFGNLIFYFSENKLHQVVFLTFTVFIFMSAQIVVVFRTYMRDYDERYMRLMYKKAALTDSLSGLASRNAFEIEINNLSKVYRADDLLFLMFIDLNSLKHVNDEFGHKKGDALIEEMGHIIAQVELEFKGVKGYRYGGDEFVLIGEKFNQNLAEELVKILHEKADAYKEENPNSLLSFAEGYVLKEVDSDFKIEDVIRLADKKMYENKGVYSKG